MQVSGLLTQPAVIHSLDSNFDVASDSGCLPSKRSIPRGAVGSALPLASFSLHPLVPWDSARAAHISFININFKKVFFPVLFTICFFPLAENDWR